MSTVPEAELRRASQKLSETYRGEGSPAAMRTAAEQVAYLAVRLPATYAAVRSVLEETAGRVEEFEPESLLDLGAGPGTALWAAAGVFPSLREFCAIERDGNLIRLGKEMASAAPHEGVRNAKWDVGDLRTGRREKQFDLVIASYSLGELAEEERAQVISGVWDSCGGSLVLVEPGTRKGFGVIAEVRDQLLSLGAQLAAPCPHGLNCPMRAAGDWCHFSARVERTAEHRRLKQGELGYEDEKFSYVVGSREPVLAAKTRIVRHPQRYSGHTKLQLCTPEGLQERTVTRSAKELYRQVKRANWGSAWEE